MGAGTARGVFVLVVMIAASVNARTRGGLPYADRWGDGIAWAPQPVRAPVRPDEVSGTSPYVRGAAAEVSGKVKVGPARGAAFWLSPLSVVLVRAQGGTPRFERVIGEKGADASYLRVEEQGVPATPGVWYVAEPVGEGSVWVITADRDTEVELFRPDHNHRALANEALRARTQEWIFGQRAMPALPLDAELRAQLQIDEQLAAALLEGVPANDPLQQAVRSWRVASALKALALRTGFDPGTSRVAWPTAPGKSLSFNGYGEPWFEQVHADGSWSFEAEGPAVVTVEARALLGGGGEPPVIELLQGGRLIGSRPLHRTQAHAEARPAIPVERPGRVTASGEPVGLADEFRIALSPGKHTVRVVWRGGRVLLRANVAQRRAWATEAISNHSDFGDWSAQAWKQVLLAQGPRAELLRALLHTLNPALGDAQVQTHDQLPPQLRALAALEAFERASDAGARRMLAAQSANLLQQANEAGELGWWLRLRAARALIAVEQDDDARTLLRSAKAFPSAGWLAAEAADVVEKLPQGEPLRSRALAALELAWRADPLSHELSRRYLDAWAKQSRWSALRPARDVDQLPPVPGRWLDRVALDTDDDAGPGALWPLHPNQPVQVRAGGTPESGEVLRAFVVASDGADGGAGTAELEVDGVRVPLPSLVSVETAEVALPPGTHSVKLIAKAGTLAWLSMSPAPQPAREEVAYLRTMWPLRARGKAVRFRIPDPQLPTPIRVQLRAPGHVNKPVHVWLRTDVGRTMRLVLHPGSKGPLHFSVDDHPGVAAPSASAVLLLPPFTREVWLESDAPDVPLYASVAVRRDRHAEKGTGYFSDSQLLRNREQKSSLSPFSVPRILELSRRLNGGETDPGLLLERASLLLDASEEGLARDDLAALLARQEQLVPDQQAQLNALLARLDDAFPDRVTFARPLEGPVVLAPGFAALTAAHDERSSAIASIARREGPARALEELGEPKSQAESYLRARLLLATGESEAAALELVRLYRDHGAPSLGLDAAAALHALESAPSTWKDWAAPMGVAVSERLLSWADLPSARKLRVAAGRWARWSRLRDVESQVGTIALVHLSPGTQLDDAVRKAVLGAPWPLEEVRVLSAGNASVLEVSGMPGAKVAAQTMCGALHPGRMGARAKCRFVLRLDGKTASEHVASLGETVALTAELTDAASHQLELTLDESEEPLAAAVRFVRVDAGKETELPAQMPMPAVRARPDAPIELVVMGPTAVRLEARALQPSAGRVVTVQDGAFAPTTLNLPVASDPFIRGAPAQVGDAATTLLLLPESGPHRLVVRSKGGEALVRMAVGRTERPDRAPAEWWSNAPTGVEPLPWPALPERMSLLPEPPNKVPMNGAGTLSFQLAALGEDEEIFEDGELLTPPRVALDGRVAWRKQLVDDRLWALVEPGVRLPLGTGPVMGGRAMLHARRLPLGLRATVSGAVHLQTQSAGTRFAARGRASVDRYFALGPDFGLIPGLGFTAEHYQGGASSPALEWDRLVYWKYGADHPLRLTPRLTLRWQPLMDHVGNLRVWAVTNSDLATLDQTTARVSWTTLLPWVPGLRGEVSYDGSWRFADAHRASPYLRHGVRGHLDVGVWTGSQGRLLVFVEDTAWFSAPFGLQNVVSAGIRWDWTGGRGLRDLMPFEEEFEDLLDDADAQ